jgi:hypothetical protein
MRTGRDMSRRERARKVGRGGEGIAETEDKRKGKLVNAEKGTAGAERAKVGAVEGETAGAD